MIELFIWIASFWSFFLFTIWRRDDFLNIFLKLCHGSIGIFGLYLIFKILP